MQLMGIKNFIENEFTVKQKFKFMHKSRHFSLRRNTKLNKKKYTNNNLIIKCCHIHTYVPA